MIKYVATKLEVKDEASRDYILHGIAAMGNGQVIESIDDISTNQQAVLSLVDRLNQCEASLIHFKDIVYDFVADF